MKRHLDFLVRVEPINITLSSEARSVLCVADNKVESGILVFELVDHVLCPSSPHLTNLMGQYVERTRPHHMAAE